MKIVFIIKRNNYFRIFNGLIREVLSQHCIVECWHDYNGDKKLNLFPSISDAPNYNIQGNNTKHISYSGDDELKHKIEDATDIDIIVSLHRILTHFNGSYPDFHKSLIWATIYHSPDSYLELTKIKSSVLSEPKIREIFFVYSEEWLMLGKKFLNQYYPEKTWLLDESLIGHKFIGNPEYDDFKNIRPEDIKKKYSIPKDKEIFLYLPFPNYGVGRSGSYWEIAFSGYFVNTLRKKNGSFDHSKSENFIKNIARKLKYISNIFFEGSARDTFLSGSNEVNLFREIKRFCKKNNLYLVVKPRLKFPVPEIIKKESDLVIWDDEKVDSAPIFKELLTISRVSLGFCSYAVTSAVFSSVYHINIKLPKIYFVNDASKFWFPFKENWLLNFKGCSKSMSIQEVINGISNADLKDFQTDIEKRKIYLERFNKLTNFGSGKIFLKILRDEMEAR